jgi:hypothetical protein
MRPPWPSLSDMKLQLSRRSNLTFEGARTQYSSNCRPSFVLLPPSRSMNHHLIALTRRARLSLSKLNILEELYHVGVKSAVTPKAVALQIGVQAG